MHQKWCCNALYKQNGINVFSLITSKFELVVYRIDIMMRYSIWRTDIHTGTFMHYFLWRSQNKRLNHHLPYSSNIEMHFASFVKTSRLLWNSFPGVYVTYHAKILQYFKPRQSWLSSLSFPCSPSSPCDNDDDLYTHFQTQPSAAPKCLYPGTIFFTALLKL